MTTTFIRITTFTIAVTIFAVPYARAGSIPDAGDGSLVTFKANTTAVAEEVNDNFTNIRNQVNDNDTRITTLNSSVGTLTTTVTTSGGVANVAKTTADTALANAATAQTTANTATTSASTALTNAAAAQTTADTAQTDASSAQTAATAAKTTADTALVNAATAQTTANTATTSASTALTNAAAAQTTADTAKADASSALTAATAAKTSADTALANAATAQTSANTANTTANTALTNAAAAQTAVEGIDVAPGIDFSTTYVTSDISSWAVRNTAGANTTLLLTSLTAPASGYVVVTVAGNGCVYSMGDYIEAWISTNPSTTTFSYVGGPNVYSVSNSGGNQACGVGEAEAFHFQHVQSVNANTTYTFYVKANRGDSMTRANVSIGPVLATYYPNRY